MALKQSENVGAKRAAGETGLTADKPAAGKQYCVYLLRCADSTLYCGITTDLIRRLKEHNAGSASHYTSSRRPVAVAAFIEVGAKGRALRIEHAIKRLPAKKKLSRLLALKGD